MVSLRDLESLWCVLKQTKNVASQKQPRRVIGGLLSIRKISSAREWWCQPCAIKNCNEQNYSIVFASLSGKYKQRAFYELFGRFLSEALTSEVSAYFN